MTDPNELRAATNGEFDEVFHTLMAAFGETADADALDADRMTFEADRMLVITHRGAIVACAGAYTRDLTVPGAIMAAAHVTYVGVLPTHRRRGMLTRMMTAQLRSVRAAGREPIAALWASEGRIYQRFGYGAAAKGLALEIDTREVLLSPGVTASDGELRAAPPEEVIEDLRRVYEQVRMVRPGWSSRPAPWWGKLTRDPVGQRHDASPSSALLYGDADGVSGYAIWRTRRGWTTGGPNGEVEVLEFAATTPAAYAGLWQFLLSVDLTRTTRYRFGALDEPIQYMVNEPRRLGARIGDALWLRVVNVPAALAGRRYAAPIDVVIDVTDALLPENAGRYELRAEAGGPADCGRTSRPADLSCDVQDLGTAYLGGVSLAALADAGRVREIRPGALGRASAAFGWRRAPSAIEVF